MARLKLSPPWDEYYRKVNALFERDPEVHVLYDEEDLILKLFVDTDSKAAALRELIPDTVNYGNVNLTIEIIPANGFGKIQDKRNAIEEAFEGNDAVVDVITTTGIGEFGATYVVFDKIVVQYFNDDLTDIHGFRSTLYEEIAREVFKIQDGVFYCTDTTNY